MNILANLLSFIAWGLRYAFPVIALTVRDSGIYYIAFLAWLDTFIAGAVIMVRAQLFKDQGDTPNKAPGEIFIFAGFAAVSFLFLSHFYAPGNVTCDLKVLEPMKYDIILATIYMLAGYILYFRMRVLSDDVSDDVMMHGVGLMLTLRYLVLCFIFGIAYFLNRFFGGYQIAWTIAFGIKICLEYAIRKIETA